MLITFIRELSEDADILRSTWHHVSEQEGMRHQVENEIEEALSLYEENYDFSSMFRNIAIRKIIRGIHHPGRKVLPHSCVSYELVYEIYPQPDISEENFFDRLLSLSDDVIYGRILRGDITERKEGEQSLNVT